MLLLPSLFAALLVYGFLSSDFTDRSAVQQHHYGQATSNQLSEYLARYVVEEDILSLNVVSTGLVNSEYIQFVAIYDNNNNLIAQSGKDKGNTTSYTSEIAFQDSVVGFIRVAVVDARPAGTLWMAALALYLIVLAVLVWRKPPPLLNWLYAYPALEPSPPEPQKDPALGNDLREEEEEDKEKMECILVARIRPAHHLERHFDRFFNAAELYGGIVEQTTPEELVIHFEGSDAMFMATSAGLLIRELTELMHGNMTFGGTLDQVSDKPDTTRKSASYLASIAEGDLLMAGGEPRFEDRIALQTFHHPLVDSQDLRRVAEFSNQALLESQARQIAVG